MLEIVMALLLWVHGTCTVGMEKTRVAHRLERVMGSLDKAIIRRITDHHVDELQACFRGTSGQVTLRYVITSAGRVSSASVLRSTADPGVGRRLAEAVREWRFPQCRCGGLVIVEQRFKGVIQSGKDPPSRS
jgi:TonB family protein